MPARRFVSPIALVLFAAITLTTAIFAAGTSAARAETLVITVRNIHSSDGDIHVALYNSKETFLADGGTLVSQAQAARQGEISFTFADLAPGTYAAAAYHDENRSGDFDTNFLGMPREGYGFSNGAKAGLGPPDFADASVPLSTITAQTNLELNY
jgi:uncharacterized protein (DUF2141 family)